MNIIYSLLLSEGSLYSNLHRFHQPKNRYDRFWEGRKAWGSIISVARYLSRYVGTISLRMRTGDMFPHVYELVFMCSDTCIA